MTHEATTFDFHPGNSPLLISIPHSGTLLPDKLRERMTDLAAVLPDTDWHLDRLYQRFTAEGAALLAAKYSRYVVDLNRPPDDQRLYTTATTGLFPRVQFDGNPIYLAGAEPTAGELMQRLPEYYWPYHQKLESVLQDLREQHGFAVLFDAHSILSRVPRLFENVLPDLNIGTNHGSSCDDALTDRLLGLCQRTPDYSHVVNGRFKGGFITRFYGQPKNRIHAVQLEVAQSTYMREDGRFAFSEAHSDKFVQFLAKWVQVLLKWAP